MTDAPAKPFDVFLSHAHVDAGIVEKLATILEDEHKLTVWLDKWVLVPGEHWQQGMAKGLDEAASCAVCIGNKTPKGWFKEEIERALNRQTRDDKFRVIPVILPDGDRSLVDQFLELRTWVDFPSTIDDADAIYGLVCGIKGVPRGRGRGTCHSVPTKQIFTVPLPENPFFTERATELADLQAALEKTGAFALTGLGGVGKTQTAAEYAHRQREHYQAVLWLRAENAETLFADLTALARLLKLADADAQEQKLAVAAAQRWLDENDNWLLILDNVNDLKTVDDLTRKARPQCRHVIVTQQAQATGAIEADKLGMMNADTGALLVLKRAKLIPVDAQLSAAKDADSSAAREISKEVGGLPLALDQAGAYISQTGCGVREYFDLLRSSMAELLDRRGDLDFQHRSVTATYTTSLTELAKHNQAAAELLNAAAFLAPDAIPEEIFAAGASHFPEALQQVAVNRLQWNDAVAAAFKFSLLERDAADKTISVHRMVQAVAKAGMTPQERAQWAERAVNAVSAAVPDPEFTNWSVYERLLPHARVCAALIEKNELLSRPAAHLLNQVGFYLTKRARYAEAEPLFRRAQAINERTLGPDHPVVAISINNLAQLLQYTNRLAEAEPLMRRALGIDEKSHGPSHPSVARDLNNLAQLLHDTNRLAEAEPLMRRALAIDEKSLGPDHPDVARDLNNLAQLLKDTDRLAEAEPLMRRALAFDAKSLGPDHPNVARDLNNLAQLLQDTNRLDEAEPLMRHALAIDEKSYGPNHPAVATVLVNLALLLQTTNRMSEAESLMRRALAIDEKSYGPNHPAVSTVLVNLAQLLQDTKRLGGAEPLMRLALEITFRFNRDNGREHPKQRSRVTNYGDLLQQMGYSDQQVRAKLHELAAQYGVSLDS